MDRSDGPESFGQSLEVERGEGSALLRCGERAELLRHGRRGHVAGDPFGQYPSRHVRQERAIALATLENLANLLHPLAPRAGAQIWKARVGHELFIHIYEQICDLRVSARELFCCPFGRCPPPYE